MKVIFLGTNGWYDTDTGNTVCILVIAGGQAVVLDAGNGIYKLNRYLGKPVRSATLLLSHLHIDHIVGFHALASLNCLDSLDIFGPEGTIKGLDTILAPPFSLPLATLPFKTAVHDLPSLNISTIQPACRQAGNSTGISINSTFHFGYAEMKHTALTLGYRLEIEGRVVTYCPDTGYCENAVTLAREADLLIAECAYRPGEANESWPHLNPESAARIARESGAKKLALVHFDASRYPDMESRQAAVVAAKKLFTNTVAAKDELEVVV
jgi:ribonuclease BN (tRNA processing enzyme)